MAEAKWSSQDEAHALAQGWSLFTVDSGDVVIQKMDDPAAHHLWTEGMPEDEVFDSDSAAIRFVRRKASQGDEVAARAIATHDAHSASWQRFRRNRRRALGC